MIVNAKGAAERLGVTQKTISTWIANGKLTHFVRMNDRCVFINLSKEFPQLFGKTEMPANVAANAGGVNGDASTNEHDTR